MKTNEYKSPQSSEILQDICLVGDTNLPSPIPHPPPPPPPPHTLGTRGVFFFPIKFPIVLRSRKTYHFKTWEVTRLTRLLMLQCSLQRCPRILLTTFYQQLKKKTVESSVTCRTIWRVVVEETHPRIIRVGQSGC